MEYTPSVRAIFANQGAMEEALRGLRDSGVRDYQAFGPVNLAALEDLMPGRGQESVRVWATIGATIGLTIFFFMCVKSSVLYDLIVGGKPPVSRVPFVIIAYEGTILLGALAAFFATVALARLVFQKPPRQYDVSFSGDSFGVVAWPEAGDRERITDLLRQAGALEIDESDRPRE